MKKLKLLKTCKNDGLLQDFSWRAKRAANYWFLGFQENDDERVVGRVLPRGPFGGRGPSAEGCLVAVLGVWAWLRFLYIFWCFLLICCLCCFYFLCFLFVLCCLFLLYSWLVIKIKWIHKLIPKTNILMWIKDNKTSISQQWPRNSAIRLFIA